MDTALVIETLKKAEHTERLARELQDQNSYCSDLTIQHNIKELFDKSWQGYCEVEDVVRDNWQLTNSNQSCLLLAQVLMDAHIHPNSGLVRDSQKLWEAQYLWLHLYYQTGNASYFNQALFCDSIRHATVTHVT